MKFPVFLLSRILGRIHKSIPCLIMHGLLHITLISIVPSSYEYYDFLLEGDIFNDFLVCLSTQLYFKIDFSPNLINNNDGVYTQNSTNKIISPK